jgi:di/tricarboxylate transporter
MLQLLWLWLPWLHCVVVVILLLLLLLCEENAVLHSFAKQRRQIAATCKQLIIALGCWWRTSAE